MIFRHGAILGWLAPALLALPAQPAPGLASGQPIRVGTGDLSGPLAPGLNTAPLGHARVFGSAQPDLFVTTNRHSQRPGIYLYPWKRTARNGAPVFGEAVPIASPFSGPEPPAGTLFETGGAIYAAFLDGMTLVWTRFDKQSNKLDTIGRTALSGAPRAPAAVQALPGEAGSLDLVFAISDGAPSRPADRGHRDPEYRPYDGAGIWRGGLPYLALYGSRAPGIGAQLSGPIRRISSTDREILWSNNRIAVANLGPDRRRDLISGSWFGNFYYYREQPGNGLNLEPRKEIVGPDGILLRHPAPGASTIGYPNPKTGLTDVVAGGEACLMLYSFTGRFTADGRPVFNQPIPVLQENAPLYAGSLPVLDLADWDGNGALDIVAGNSEGRVLFFANRGSSARPAFENGVPVEAGGAPIHVQPGYKGDVQGPGEARWGYISPTVVDWNGDGLLDIVASDSTARHEVYLNRGRPGNPALAAAHPLYMDGLDLHGSWRVKPGAGRMGKRMAYVALDDHDQFHLYWRIDNYNLADGGKLRLKDGSAIGANFLAAGGTGRSKISLYDWDRDGVVDLIVGTPRHGSVPEPKKGLPQSLGLPGAAVLWLRNTGSNDAPAFAYPAVLAHDGKPVFFGQHECGAAVGDLGGAGSLVVGHQDGFFVFFSRERLSALAGR